VLSKEEITEIIYQAIDDSALLGGSRSDQARTAEERLRDAGTFGDQNLAQFTRAGEKLVSLGMDPDDAFHLLVRVRERQRMSGADPASLYVTVRGEDVAVVRAFADGTIEIRRKGENETVL